MTSGETPTVRAASVSDAAAIAAVGRATWPSTYAFAGSEFIADGLARWWSPESVIASIESTNTYLAEIDEMVVGMGNIDLRPDIPTIWKLYVRPEHQGVGAGHLLMNRLLEDMPTGAPGVVLEYVDGNENAASFYRRHGFTELRREPGEQPDWPEAVWMIRNTAALA